MRRLFAGPYDYEFGHELFSFQGHIRKLSRDYEKTVVCSKECMEFLYRDFVDEFIPLGNPYRHEQSRLAHKIVSMDECRASVSRGVGIFGREQEFVKYGSLTDEKYDVIIHAREKRGRMSINLDERAHQILFEELSKNYSVAFMGSKGASHCPDGARDLRGIPLSKLADIIYSSRLVVGQSSGPIHFSSLCTTPHFTWGGYRLRTYARYSHHWNPFKTLCFLLESPESYLSNRIRRARLPRDILDRDYFNIVETKNYRHPPTEELLLKVRNVLESSKLNDYNEKRLLRNDA